MKRTALITGATSGIGKATALKLSDNGFNLILCGRRVNRINELESLLSSKVDVISLVFDVRDELEVKKQLNSLPANWQNIDILVNSAGNAHGFSSIHEVDTEDLDAMIDGNVKGLLYVSKSVIPLMVRRKTGHIINISSIAGKQVYENGVIYSASKKAVEAMSEGMRLELVKHNIKVTNLAPGAVETGFSEVRFKGDKAKAKSIYKGFEPLVAEDIADLIFYIINAPDRVNVADVTILPKAQSAVTTIYKR